MAFARFTPSTNTHTATNNSKLVLSGVTKILFTPYVQGAGGAWSLGTTTYQLDNIIADSVAISQDDPEENTIDCETRDEPIKKTVVNGNFNVEMVSADIQKDILVACFGYVWDSSNEYVHAPANYQEAYALIEFTFGGNTEVASLVCPKVQISSKIDASSLKTETVKGTISGTCMSVTIGEGGSAYDTPFLVNISD